ncbi:lipopolysaccharide biosynthesis protein [Allofournierella sp.]|uniref:lipopolysaccharide biosynthesis protein n=1 Tax=Allofournierella sp. TaxID=1940256 RepID=UPI003AB2EA7D
MRNNFISKYKYMGEPVKASLWFMICSFLQKGIAFVVIPIYTRVMSTEQYGTYSVFVSWVEILFVFTSLYLHGNTFAVGLVKFKQDRDRFTSSLLGLCIVTALVISASYILAPQIWQIWLGLNNALCIVLWTYLFFLPFLRFWSAKQRFNYKYKAMVAVTLGISAVTPLIGIVAMHFTKYKAEAAIFSKAIVESIAGVVFLVLLFGTGKTFYNKEYWLYGLKANIPLIPYYLSATFLSYIDRIMIETYCGKSQAGIYSVAHSAAMILLFINSALNSSLTPWLFQKMDKGEGKDNIALNRALTLGVTVVNLLLILFAPEIIRVMAPQKYSEAIFVIPPLAIAVIFNFIYQQFINVEFFYEANRFTMIASIFVAVLNMVLNALLIPAFGYLAAGYTTLASYFMFMVCHYICVKLILKKRNVKERYFDFRFLAILVGIVLVLMTMLVLVYNWPVVRYLLIGSIFCIILYKRKNIFLLIERFRNKS